MIDNSRVDKGFPVTTSSTHIWTATPGLRINDGKLEQAWCNLSTGKHEWRLVPSVKTGDAE